MEFNTNTNNKTHNGVSYLKKQLKRNINHFPDNNGLLVQEEQNRF
jgi:hypothetical protein